MSRLLNFVQTGPLFRTLPAVSIEEWHTHGSALAQSLAAPNTKESVLSSRIYHFYLPVYFWCREIVRKARSKEPNCAVGIGLSAPQGCGKTTLVDFLTGCFKRDGLVCTAVSFDDFYLTGEEQDALAATHPFNPLLQVRGNAGTHDVDLGAATLRSLLQRDENVSIPRYNKSARSGRGDRFEKKDWSVQREKVDVVLLEGWMAGFQPLAETGNITTTAAKATATATATATSTEGVDEINSLLERYSEWHEQLAAWVVVAIDDVQHVYRWRLEAEQAMKASGRDGMTDEEVRDFVSRYMPAYETFLPALYAASLDRGVGGKSTLIVNVDGDRKVVPAK